jgi:hypothetical protein
MGDSKPIAMDFKIGRLAIRNNISISSMRWRSLGLNESKELRAATYYAGKRSILNAAATMAHCVNEGWKSAIALIHMPREIDRI